MKLLKTTGIALLCSLLIWVPTGCSQSKVDTVIQDIANWTPIVVADATALLSDLAGFEAGDAAQIQTFVMTLNTDANTLTTLCNQYLAAPTSTLLNQIAALVGTMATTDASAVLALLQIKNANSQMIAKGILSAIASALTIISGLLSGVGVGLTSAARASLEQLRPYVNRDTLSDQLAVLKSQGLVRQNSTLAQFGF